MTKELKMGRYQKGSIDNVFNRRHWEVLKYLEKKEKKRVTKRYEDVKTAFKIIDQKKWGSFKKLKHKIHAYLK